MNFKLLAAAAALLISAQVHANTLNIQFQLPKSVSIPDDGTKPRLKITLWGADDLVADASASQLRTIEKKITTLIPNG